MKYMSLLLVVLLMSQNGNSDENRNNAGLASASMLFYSGLALRMQNEAQIQESRLNRLDERVSVDSSFGRITDEGLNTMRAELRRGDILHFDYQVRLTEENRNEVARLINRTARASESLSRIETASARRMTNNPRLALNVLAEGLLDNKRAEKESSQANDILNRRTPNDTMVFEHHREVVASPRNTINTIDRIQLSGGDVHSLNYRFNPTKTKSALKWSKGLGLFSAAKAAVASAVFAHEYTEYSDETNTTVLD